jgi:DNA-binding NtrC family response regulator
MGAHKAAILVVDDDHNVLEIVQLTLTSLGYQVIPTDSVRHALSLIRECPWIALLFTDIVLPGELDGVDLARLGKGIRSNLKVLFMTGGSQRSGEAIAEYGPLLHKPWRFAELDIAVRQILALADPALAR